MGVVAVNSAVGQYPTLVIAAYVFIESCIGLGHLHLEHGVHIRRRIGQFHFPEHQTPIQIHPIGNAGGIIDGHRQPSELMTIVGSSRFADQSVAVQVLFQRYEYLIRIDRLDEVIGDFITYGLIHNIFLFALSDHYHRYVRLALLDGRESLEASQTRHLLVEYNQIEMSRSAHIQGIAPAHSRGHVIAFALEE